MRSAAEIAGFIRQQVEEVTLGAVTADGLPDDAELIAGIGLDSLDYATVILACEKWLGLRVSEEDVDWAKLGTIAGLAAFLAERSRDATDGRPVPA